MKRKETRNMTFQNFKHGRPNEGEWIVYVTKTFSTTRFGTKEAALEKAQKFRNWMYSLLYRAQPEDYIQENVNYSEHRRPNKTYLYYRATFYEDGKRKVKSFNIEKLGKEKALELAKQRADIGKRHELLKAYAKEDALTIVKSL